MKKIFKVLGILVVVLILIAITGFIVINSRGIPTYQPGNNSYNLNSTPESVERGKNLSFMLCANCHMNRETGKLTGVRMKDAPPEFGIVNSPNITQNKEHGIGAWTDAELVYLLRTGIKRDGSYAPPYMAKLPNLADEDMNAIISFLRSNDPMVADDPTPDVPCEPSFLTKLLCTIAFTPLPMPEKSIPMPDTSNNIALGKYLAHNLECFSCHSGDFKTNDYLNPENSKLYFGGGNKPLNMEGKVMFTANLTPDVETGIGGWSKDKFINAVKYGQMEGEAALQYPMMPYIFLTDKEVTAIYHYLKSIPPIKNKVERSI